MCCCHSRLKMDVYSGKSVLSTILTQFTLYRRGIYTGGGRKPLARTYILDNISNSTSSFDSVARLIIVVIEN